MEENLEQENVSESSSELSEDTGVPVSSDNLIDEQVDSDAVVNESVEGSEMDIVEESVEGSESSEMESETDIVEESVEDSESSEMESVEESETDIVEESVEGFESLEVESETIDVESLIQLISDLEESSCDVSTATVDLYDSETGIYRMYDSMEAFQESPVYVTRYEYELLNRLEFIQYALVILIALIFLLIFKRKVS